jgi:hypothetical protein
MGRWEKKGRKGDGIGHKEGVGSGSVGRVRRRVSKEGVG